MKDFFISYNSADKSWAVWIAWQLEEAGYTTIIQEWDFGVGGNFVQEMQKATSEAKRTIIVLSPDWLSAQYTWPEFSAAFVQDPTGNKRLLVPIRVKPCELPGLLHSIVYIDLVGVDETEAHQRLLDGVRLERKKPSASPPFPSTARPAYPGTDQEKPPSGSSGKTNVLNPEFAAAMLDKECQVTHVMNIAPKDIRLRNGKTIGLVLSGHSNEWPEAVRYKLAYKLMPKDTGRHGVVFFPLQGESEDNLMAGEFLRQLLASNLHCGESETALAAELAPPDPEHQKPHIFYRVLSPQEAKNHGWLVEILQAWNDLGLHLPPHSPSHFLILIHIHPVMEKQGGLFSFWRRDDIQTWLEAMTHALKPCELLNSLLPKLESPKRDEVPSWAFNHLPENIKDEIQEKVEAVFGDQNAKPHGELKKHIVDLLRPHAL
jgi:hypothetical protein